MAFYRSIPNGSVLKCYYSLLKKKKKMAYSHGTIVAFINATIAQRDFYWRFTNATIDLVFFFFVV